MDLNEIKNSLNSNPNLTDIQDCLMELIYLFNSKFPNINLNNLNERLKTLKIIKGSKYLVKNSSHYNPVSNELLINLSKLDNNDCKHILMRELLNIITAKDNYTGFNKDNSYEALNIGYTERLTNFLVGNETESEYEDEIIASNILEKIVGEDKMFNAYFTNNVNLIFEYGN